MPFMHLGQERMQASVTAHQSSPICFAFGMSLLKRARTKPFCRAQGEISRRTALRSRLKRHHYPRHRPCIECGIKKPRHCKRLVTAQGRPVATSHLVFAQGFTLTLLNIQCMAQASRLQKEHAAGTGKEENRNCHLPMRDHA